MHHDGSTTGVSGAPVHSARARRACRTFRASQNTRLPGAWSAVLGQGQQDLAILRGVESYSYRMRRFGRQNAIGRLHGRVDSTGLVHSQTVKVQNIKINVPCPLTKMSRPIAWKGRIRCADDLPQRPDHHATNACVPYAYPH